MPIRRRSASSTTLRASRPHSSDTCALSLKWGVMLMIDLGGHRLGADDPVDGPAQADPA